MRKKWLGTLGLFVAPADLALASPPSIPATPAWDSCCTIRAIDTRTGVVSVQQHVSGRTFHCKVVDATALRHLTIGQQVRAGYFTGRLLSAAYLRKEQEHQGGRQRRHTGAVKLEGKDTGLLSRETVRPRECTPR